VIGTVNYRFKDKVIVSKNTTPSALDLQSMFSEMLKNNIKFAVMEVSSHALDQARPEAIDFHSAIFTNLTQDHLDYHRNLENYFCAKAKLFQDLNAGAFCVLNNDDPYGRRLKQLTRSKVVTYGIDTKSDVMAQDIKSDITGTEFNLITGKAKKKIRTRLIGRYNVYNILAAAAWALAAGLNPEKIRTALEKFALVPGRLQRVDSREKFSVFVDYAHTEDALKNVIRALRPLTKGKLIVVFGCGGDRDKDKRPKMGRVVSELADFALVTSDNPRSEEPRQIIEEIKKGMKKNNYLAIEDRKEAISKALSMARPGDIVLLAGKGHENYQVLKDRTVAFDDCEVARECLGSMNY